MTKEKAIKYVNAQLDKAVDDADFMEDEMYDALQILVKIAEQEPCEDTISRAEAIRLAEQGQVQGFEWQIRKLVALPPVTPKGVTVTDFADKCRECGARYGKKLKKLERIKARYNEERTILLNSNLEYTPNNVLDIIDYIIHGD